MRNNNNAVWLGGNLTADAELINIGDSGTQQLRFSIAVNRAGSERDSAGFFNVKMWLTKNDYSVAADVDRALADYNEGHLTKGTHVSVEGRLQHETWTDKDSGQKRSGVSIIADGISVRVYNKEGGTEAKAANPKPAAAAATVANVPDSF